MMMMMMMMMITMITDYRLQITDDYNGNDYKRMIILFINEDSDIFR